MLIEDEGDREHDDETGPVEAQEEAQQCDGAEDVDPEAEEEYEKQRIALGPEMPSPRSCCR